MKTSVVLAAVLFGATCTSLVAAEPTIDNMPPVVVKTVPEAGAKNVAPGITEIKVTFSKKMADHSWSWSTVWSHSDPEVIGKPHYEADGRTCVLKVRLEPNKTYGYWLNSQKFKNFKDDENRPAIPYLFVFKTSDK